MPAESTAKEKDDEERHRANADAANGKTGDAMDHASDDEEEEEEDEPRLKYTKLTGSLSSVYRNGDATSSFVVAGDKMVGYKPYGQGLVGTLTGIDHWHTQWQYCKLLHYLSS